MLLLKTNEEKEKFYEDLQAIHNKIPKHDIVIILGDMNTKIGNEHQNLKGRCIPKHSR